jgi:hypothetical protein
MFDELRFGGVTSPYLPCDRLTHPTACIEAPIGDSEIKDDVAFNCSEKREFYAPGPRRPSRGFAPHRGWIVVRGSRNQQYLVG